MLSTNAGTVAKRVELTCDCLDKNVYEILCQEKSNKAYAYKLEDQVFDTLKKYDITYLQLIIEKAFENYLHNQFSTDYIKTLEKFVDYVPSEDKFLRLTHYVNSRIVYLKNIDELDNAYKNGRYTFEKLETEMNYLIQTDIDYKVCINRNPEYSDECAYMFEHLKDYDLQLLDELYIYVLSLYDQISDPNVRVFTIGDKIDKEYNYILNVKHLKDIIFAYMLSLYEKDKTEEEDKTRTRSIDNNLPFEI